MHVRRIQPDDGVLLRSVRLSALSGAPDAFGTTYAEALASPPDAWERRAATCSVDDTTSLFFAEDDGTVVGMAGGIFEDGDPVPSLISMWVDPAARGRGGGEALIEAVAAWARSQGATVLQLWVTSTNAHAIALYRRTGFVDTGETQVLPSNPSLIENRMVRTL